MKKTGLKSRSRRKTTTGTTHTPTQSTSNPLSSSSDASTGNVVNSTNSSNERRKPTSEEAALTAKNYRLAKELSELRVRHRDETKNVTRLTMENMNLASRCREAISHVAMLKKELAIHQRKNAELIAIQKQNISSKGTSNNVVSVGNSDASDVRELENIMIDHSSPTLSSDPRAAIVPQDQDPSIENQRVMLPPDLSSQKAEKSKIQSIGNNRRDTRPKIQTTRQSSPSDRFKSRPLNNNYETDQIDVSSKLQTEKTTSSSPAPVIVDDSLKDATNKEPHDAFGELQTSNFFQNSYKLSLETTPERDDVLEDNKSSDIDDFKPFITPTNAAGRSNDTQSTSTSSGMDAFDASFMTTFPSSFPTSTATLSPTVNRAFDIPDFPDEFFLGSPEGNISEDAEKKRSNSHVKPDSQSNSSDSISTTQVPNKKNQKDHLFPSNAMSSFEAMSLNNQKQHKSPKPKSVRSDDAIHKSKNMNINRTPSSEEKLRDSQGTNKPTNENKGLDEHSPTLVLRRLQQRRAKERASASGQKTASSDGGLSRDKRDGQVMNGDNSITKRDDELSSRQDLSTRFGVSRQSTGRKVSALSAESVNDEIRNLDAIANNSTPPKTYPAHHSKRRNVKQPVSYAEPPLNSKLRRGDVYFPKKGQMNSIEKEDSGGNQTIDSEYQSFGKSRKKDVDDVLKDLVTTSTI